MSAQVGNYYNNPNMKHFYTLIYGGDNIHMGLYKNGNESIPEANRQTIDAMTSLLDFSTSTLILDIGSGYGGTARHLVQTMNCA